MFILCLVESLAISHQKACCRAVAQDSFPVAPVAGPAATATLPLAAAVPTHVGPVEWNLCHSPYGSCPKMEDTGIPEMPIKHGWLMLGNPQNGHVHGKIYINM